MLSLVGGSVLEDKHDRRKKKKANVGTIKRYENPRAGYKSRVGSPFLSF